MRLEENDLHWVQRNFKYAAMNELLPGLITAHITDMWRKQAYEITAYTIIDGEAYRVDLEISYDEYETIEQFVETTLLLIDTHVEQFKENKSECRKD